jgi:hypothetical protein
LLPGKNRRGEFQILNGLGAMHRQNVLGLLALSASHPWCRIGRKAIPAVAQCQEKIEVAERFYTARRCKFSSRYEI